MNLIIDSIALCIDLARGSLARRDVLAGALMAVCTYELYVNKMCKKKLSRKGYRFYIGSQID
jgi:hypothetical protein